MKKFVIYCVMLFAASCASETGPNIVGKNDEIYVVESVESTRDDFIIQTRKPDSVQLKFPNGRYPWIKPDVVIVVSSGDKIRRFEISNDQPLKATERLMVIESVKETSEALILTVRGDKVAPLRISKNDAVWKSEFESFKSANRSLLMWPCSFINTGDDICVTPGNIIAVDANQHFRLVF